MPATRDLLALSSVELRRRIGTKEISPVELLEAAISRIEQVNPAVNAVAATAFAQGRKAAKAAEKAVRDGDELGALHGLPTGIKDLEPTAGLLSTSGSPLYRDFIPEHDAAMVARVRKAGALIVAKTNVPEFGAGANTKNRVFGAKAKRDLDRPDLQIAKAGQSVGNAEIVAAVDRASLRDHGAVVEQPGVQ